ncbi:MAG: ABC transporter substrate-binding protein [Chloroflexi bacterium]|nr:ABC transporter substrate-binding protein [Chloroflexota bacterium]
MISGGKLHLTLACGDYDINRGLIDGTIQPEGIALATVTLPSPERHWRMMRGHEFDLCELSLASYLMLRDQRLHPFIAIPAFPHRRFRHSYIFVNASAGLSAPKDLEGRRVGVRTWQTTAGLWTRGILEEQYGVDLAAIQWIRQDEEDIPFTMPPEFKVTQLRRDQNMNHMLVEGEVDALIYPEIPSAFKQGDPRVRRLFSNAKAEEQRYYRETGHFPLMHTVVAREALLERYPWVATSMLKAFRASKELAWRLMEDPRRVSLAWLRELIEEQREVMGRDPWPYDLPSNRKGLETMIRYSHRQGMIQQPMAPEELFFPPSLEEMPVGYV